MVPKGKTWVTKWKIFDTKRKSGHVSDKIANTLGKAQPAARRA